MFYYTLYTQSNKRGFMAIIDRLDQALSITDMVRSSKAILDTLASGKQDKYVVMRNNMPAAVMLNIEVYEALIDALEEYTLDQKAASRVASFSAENALSQEELLSMFGDKASH
jgi:antitoxin StbD